MTETVDTAPPRARATSARASVKVAPELVMLRHHDYTRALKKFGEAALSAHVARSERLADKVARNFWGNHDHHPNRVVLQKSGHGEDDLEVLGRMWAGGFLAYRTAVPTCEVGCWRKSFRPRAKEDDSSPCRDCRDLHHYLRQRMLELLDIARRQARSCTPPSGADQREDVEQSSLGQSSRDGEAGFELVERLHDREEIQEVGVEAVSRRKVVNLCKIQLLERLAVHSDEEAVAILSSEELAGDLRSQGGRLLQEVGSCEGRGECSLCRARTREPDHSLVAPELDAEFPALRAYLEQFLAIESEVWRQLLKATPKAERPQLEERHRHAGHALGLLARNADGSMSATRHTFALLRAEVGSLEERAVLATALASSPTVISILKSESADRRTLACVEEWQAYAMNSSRKSMKKQKLKDQWTAELAKRAEDAKKGLDKDTQYPCLKSAQNGRDFYTLSIPVDDLFDYCTIDRHATDPETGYQRVLDEKRADEIAEYLNTPGNSIPGVVILSARPEAKLEYHRSNKCLRYERVAGAFSVLDGQHRLHGFHRSKERHRVNVLVYVGLDRAEEARLFLDLNTKGKNIAPALIKGVKAVAGTESESESFLRRLFSRLGSEADSPLKGRLAPAGAEAGKLPRNVFDAAVGKAVRRELLAKATPERQTELVVAYVKAVGKTLGDAGQLVRKDFFGAVMDSMDLALRVSKRELGTVKGEALEKVVARFRALTEADCPGAGRRAQLSERMGNCLNPTDVSVDD